MISLRKKISGTFGRSAFAYASKMNYSSRAPCYIPRGVVDLLGVPFRGGQPKGGARACVHICASVHVYVVVFVCACLFCRDCCGTHVCERSAASRLHR